MASRRDLPGRGIHAADADRSPVSCGREKKWKQLAVSSSQPESVVVTGRSWLIRINVARDRQGNPSLASDCYHK